MLLFKYPLMKRALLKYKDEIIKEQDEAKEDDPDAESMDEDEIKALAYSRLMEQGVGTNDITEVVCNDYTEQEVKNDRNSIDWESAHEEVEVVEETRKHA
jgi:hypothetical protein